MLHFEHPQLLLLLLLIPVLTGVFVYARITSRKRLEAFADSRMFSRLTPDVSRRRPIIKFALMMLALGFLILAVANPQVGSKMVKGERLGADVAVCFDVSNSMMAEDIQPNRLECGKRFVTNLLNELGSDRVSLVVFAGTSFIQMPLTSDYSATKMFLEQIDCSLIDAQGTAIGDAIDKAMETFGYGDPDREWEQNKSRAIIVVSDGENHEDDAAASARAAKAEGVSVSTVGMGLPQGAPIPIYRNGQQVDYKHDRDGNTVTTQLNESMLAEIAQAGGGTYVRAGNTNAGISKIVDQIEELEKENYGEAMFSEYESRYMYPLLAALVCLVADLLLFEKRNAKFNIGKLLRRNDKKNDI